VRILITRPAPDNARTAAALRRSGHEVALSPLLEMEAISAEIPDRNFSAVVLTSGNAARALQMHPLGNKLLSLPVFAVGSHTAEVARDVGFREVHAAAGDKQQLLELLHSRCSGACDPLLYLAGEDRAGELVPQAPTFTIVTAVIYRMVKRGRLDAAVETALVKREIDGVLHFSRRSAETYLECARHAGIERPALSPIHYCLSQQVAEPLASAGASAIRVALQPDERGLLDLLGCSLRIET